MSQASYRLDRVRAGQVLWALSHAMADRIGLLNEQEDLVENQIPPDVASGSREHALFLFFVVPNDRGVRSAHLWHRAKDLYTADPELFEPEKVTARFTSNPESLRALLQDTLKPRYAGHAARAWLANSSELSQRFAADPRQLFTASTDAPELLDLICSFHGFGPKTGGMLLRAVIGLGFANPRNVEAAEMPVDIHDTRISFLTNILRFADPKAAFDAASYMTFTKPVRRFLSEVCAAESIPWPDVDRALWLIGSRGCAPKRCGLCPISSFCSFYASDADRQQGLFDQPAASHRREAN
jgi:endonuclease III